MEEQEDRDLSPSVTDWSLFCSVVWYLDFNPLLRHGMFNVWSVPPRTQIQLQICQDKEPDYLRD